MICIAFKLLFPLTASIFICSRSFFPSLRWVGDGFSDLSKPLCSALLHPANRSHCRRISSRCSCPYVCCCCAENGRRRGGGVASDEETEVGNGDRLTRRCLLVSTRSRPSPLLHLSSTHRSLCSTHTHSSLPPHVVGVWERRRRRLVCCVCCFSVSGRRRRCGRARVHPLPIRKVRRLHPRGQGRRRRGCIVAD